MSEWHELHLRECVNILTGFPFSSAHYDSDKGGVPLLRGDNIGQGVLRWDGAKRLPKELAKSHQLYQLAEGDVVIAMDRPWIEAGLKHGRIRNSELPCLLVQRVARLRATARLDQRFLHYLLSSKAFTEHVLAVQTGTAVPHISSKQIGEFKPSLPQLEEQRAIAQVLATLDDKIQNNNSQVTRLNSFATASFREWRSSLTETTESTFGELSAVHGGSTPKTGIPDYWGGTHAWAVPRDVTALTAPYLFDTERHITDAGLESIGNRLHPAGSILMTSRATIGAFAVTQTPCATNQGFIVVVPMRAVLRWYIFHEMQSRLLEFFDLANGSTFLEISRGNFKSIGVQVPRSQDVESLDRLVSPLHELSASKMSESLLLAKLRDTLLPPLMSGQLRVRDVEELVEGAV